MRVAGKQKIFCIGLHKTGTTSLAAEMKGMNFVVGNQLQATLLFDDWIKRDFTRLRKYCRTAQFFQDIPFCFPHTYIAIDQFFPGSKYILTVRDNAEQWYNSLINFHTKYWGNGNMPPTPEDLKKADYIYRGFPYHVRMHVAKVPPEEPYKKDVLLKYYNDHIENVKDYFRHRPEDLLVINLSNDADYERFCAFVNRKPVKQSFIWRNKT